MNKNRPSSTFPSTLMKVWNLADSESEVERQSDALGYATRHRKIKTSGGEYWVCSETGQLERTEAGAQLADMYDSFWRGEVAQNKPNKKELADARELMSSFESFRKTGRMFEYACGLGTVIESAKELGWEADGVECSPYAVDQIKKRTGIAVRLGIAEDIEFEAGAYDVMIMDNIFEHLFEPRRVLEEVARGLRPGGVIYMQTLNAQSYSLRSQPRNWFHYNEGHLFVPTLVSFDHYLKVWGLEVVWLRTKGYRPRPDRDRDRYGVIDRVVEKTISNVARMTRRGHRLECVLRRPE